MTIDHLNNSGMKGVSAYFSQSHILEIHNYFLSFSKTVVDMAEVNPEWSQTLPPDDADMEHHNAAIELCMPNLHTNPERRRSVAEAFHSISNHKIT